MSTVKTVKSWRWRMVKAGHTQQTLEKYTGIDQSLISRYMSGKTSPPLEAFDKIESFLKSQGV